MIRGPQTSTEVVRKSALTAGIFAVLVAGAGLAFALGAPRTISAAIALVAGIVWVSFLWRQHRLERLEEERAVLREPTERAPAAVRTGRPPSLTMLLRPEFGVVPFRAREAELAQLAAWCSSKAELAVSLLLGSGGTGKSRLAAELCRCQATKGTLAGFLRPSASGKDVAALSARRPLLVIVDEAHARGDQIADLLTALTMRRTRTPVRVLLVSRQRGQWWDTRLPALLDHDASAIVIHGDAHILEIGPVHESPAGRAAAYKAAANAFAGRLGHTAHDLGVPDLAGPDFAPILFVHLAALSAVHGSSAPSLRQPVRRELLHFVLEREHLYWADTAKDHGLHLEPAVLRAAVALATLTVADSEDQTVSMLTAIPDLADAPGQRRPAARWLRGLYPPAVPHSASGIVEDETTVWCSLTPDMLAEALIAQVVGELPMLPTRLLDDANSAQTNRALRMLGQTARDDPSIGQPVTQALAKHLASLWSEALIVSQEGADPIGRLLAEALEAAPDPEVAALIEAALPSNTVALRELAVVATHQALQYTLEQPTGIDRDQRAASLHNKHSERLSEVGRLEDALVASDDAVRIYRDLAALSGAVSPNLAMALNSQSNQLSALGRTHEALAAIEEAVHIYRGQAKDDQDAALPNLSASLITQGSRLGDMGRREDALEALEEAVGIQRALAETRPEDFMPELAAGLNNQSNDLRAVGRQEDALAASEESVGVYRKLASDRADAFLPGLAISLHTHSSCLDALGRRDEALAAIDESVGIRRHLARDRPDAFLSDLAVSLNRHANALGDVGRREDALATVEESVSIYRDLVRDRPAAFLPGLAMALNNQSNELNRLGRRPHALAAIEESVSIHRDLVRAHADAFLPDLARGLNNQCNTLSDMGRLEDALDSVGEAIGIQRGLAQAHPETFLPDLAMSLNTMAGALGELERPEDALAAIEESVDLYRDLAQTLADAFLPDLARALNNHSGCLAHLGRPEPALAAIEEAVGIGRGLVHTHADAFLPDLATSLFSQWARLDDVGRSEQALVAIEQAVTILRDLAQAHPEAFLPDLARSLMTWWTSLDDGKEPERGLLAVDEAVSIYRNLAQECPDAFLPDLALALYGQSGCLNESGRPEDALVAIGEAIAIYRDLAQAQPAVVLPELAAALNDQSGYLSDSGRHEEAQIAAEEARGTLRRIGDTHN